MSQSSYDKALEELIALGIMPDTEAKKVTADNVTDSELQLISNMETIAGVKYSEEQKKILTNKGNSCIIACAGSGKALANGTKVLTNIGYKNIEELVKYNIVYNELGEEELVLGVYPQGEKRVYKLTMNDGHVIECCEDHLWTVELSEIYETKEGKRFFVKYFRVLSTKQLYEEYRDTEISLPTARVYAGDNDLSMYDNLFESSKDELVDMLISNNLIGYTKASFGNLRDWSKIEIIMELTKFWNGKTIKLRDKSYNEEIRLALELYGNHCSTEVRADELGSYIEFTVINPGKSSIVNIEKTNEFKEMTCIKVSGKSELFLTEHCYVTHNTTVLTNLIAKRILTGEIKDTRKLVCTTYSKGGATEMEDRLHALLQKFGIDTKIKVATMHAFFLSIIRTFGVNMYILDEGERLKMIKESAKEADLELRDEDLADLSNLISYQINNLMSDKKALSSEANTLEQLTLDKYGKVRKGFAIKKAMAMKMDFDDMQLYLYKWLVKDKTSENEAERVSAMNVRNYCQAMWDDFYIDEAQDISKIQFAIIREMIQDPNNKGKLVKNLTFVGDDDQCIYKWRGADPSIILNIGNQFDMRLLMLSTNYRCAENIVNFAAESVQHNSARYSKSMKAFNKGGNVQIALTNKGDLCNLSGVALNHIKKLIESGENAKDICVMSRNNFHLAILNNMLLHEGIYTTCTNDMKLTNSSMYKDIKLILRAMTDEYDVNITKGILWKLCKFMSVANANAIGKFQDEACLSLRQTLAYLFRYCDYDKSVSVIKDKDGKEKDPNIHRQVEDNIRYTWRKLNFDTKNYMRKVLDILELDSDAKKIAGLLTMYINCSGELMYKREDKQRSLKGLCNYISLLIDKAGYNATMDFLRISEQYEQGNLDAPGQKVTLTTIHSAKGKEWKNVIAFAVDNVTMPGFEDIKSMIKENNSLNEINEYIDEERRLYYVEMTRAKKNLLIVTNEPSVFLMESLKGIRDTGEPSNNMIIDCCSSDSYVSAQQRSNIYNQGVLQEKVLSEDGEYHYNV